MNKGTFDAWLETNFEGLCREHHFAAHRCPNCLCEKERDGRPARKWRFDWAWPTEMIAIEYEGMLGRGPRCRSCGMVKSRHTTVTGFAKDAEKYNTATLMGWSVIRVTAKTIEQAATYDLIEELFRTKKRKLGHYTV